MLLTPQQATAIQQSGDDDLLRLAYYSATEPLYTFKPRDDRPDEYDEQDAFVAEKEAKFSICLGGTGSGKTEAAAFKTACYVLENPPPRPRVPFWIVGDTYDMVCDVCWNEKLCKYIPEDAIYDTVWYQRKRNWPFAVLLKHLTEPGKVGWVLEFKSYEQGLGTMKSKSIGGYWFNEEVPYSIVQEVQGRCRDYDSPGWADFTPIEVKSPEWLEAYERPPEGWKFFHLNTRLNPVVEAWADRYLRSIPEDMRETRTIGKFAVLRGQVFKEFRRGIHVIEPFPIPRDWRKIRGLDFGYNNPFACVWVARDHDDRYYVYDLHYQSQQVLRYHAQQINEREWEPQRPWYGPTYSDHDAQVRAELAEMSEYGINCTPANKAINSGIELLRSLMMLQGDGKPRLYIFDHCRELIDEVIGYKWPEGTTGRNPADTPVDKDNHAIDALRYAIYSDRSRALDAIPTTRRSIRDSRRHGVLLTGRR